RLTVVRRLAAPATLPYERHRTLRPNRRDRESPEQTREDHAGDANRRAGDLMRFQTRAEDGDAGEAGHQRYEKSEQAGARGAKPCDAEVPNRPRENDWKENGKEKRTPDSPPEVRQGRVQQPRDTGRQDHERADR